MVVVILFQSARRLWITPTGPANPAQTYLPEKTNGRWESGVPTWYSSPGTRKANYNLPIDWASRYTSERQGEGSRKLQEADQFPPLRFTASL